MGRRRKYDSPQAKREAQRQWAANWRAKNPNYDRDQKRSKRASGEISDRRYRHGPHAEIWFAQTFLAQGGRCYLCDDELDVGTRFMHTDHDHGHCPAGTSCSVCRRGICCLNCNLVLGLVADDPDRLMRIAQNLRPVLAATRQKIAAAPMQEMLTSA